MVEPNTSPETLADLLERLGDIPPDRVRLRPYPGTATEADVIGIEARENRLFELVEGVLVEKGLGYRESLLAGLIITLLNQWVLPRKLGMVTGADGMMRLSVGLVRIPDVAFVSWDRLPDRRVPSAPIPQLAPDLAVEVLSESNTKKEMTRKRGEYFDARVRLVWIVDPATHTVSVYTSPERFIVLQKDQTLDGGDVLSGSTLRFTDLFSAIEGL